MEKNDIAIIGLSFEFPQVNSLESLWSGLMEGKCFYNIETSQDPHIVAAWGSVKKMKEFDYRFFGYSFKEACYLDPQQRLLLQHSWHALENAGYMNVEKMPITSVFAAASINNYLHDNLQGQLNPNNEDEIVIGNITDFVATRIAYKLNLKGAALTVQSGCSSGLACIHEARIALLTHQCQLSVVGAVSLSAPHNQGYSYCSEGIRSIDGQIRPFDNRATGTVFTNGVAVLVLKRLIDARQDGDQIYGVIAGTALNNDGSHKASFTAPTISGQSQVIKRAMQIAKAVPEDFVLIEAHGTGTSLGDPIEFEGLCQAFDRFSSHPFCALQSIKANVGHLDTVSGIAGVIKAMLVLEKQQLPPQIHFIEENPKIRLSESPFYINKGKQAIYAKEKLAGVTALGIGGTNAHVILRHYERPSQKRRQENQGGLLLLSTKSIASFEQLQECYKTAFNSSNSPPIEEASYTSIVGRTHFNYRKALWVEQDKPLKADGIPDPLKGAPQSIVFLFPGQGSQYPRMGYQLYCSCSIFKEKLDDHLKVLSDLTGYSFKELLFSEDPKKQQQLYQTEYTQPILLACEVALAEILMSLGVQPTALLGHSLGEYTALVVSKALDFEQTARIVLKRAQLMAQVGSGAMLSVMIDSQRLEKILPDTLDIAAFNAPGLIAIGGSSIEIDRFAALCVTEKIFFQKLPTNQAYHSRNLDPILEEFRKEISTLSFKPPQLPIISNLDASPLTYDRLSQANYWMEQIRRPVRFSSCVEFLQNQYHPLFVEVGPGTTLKTLTERIIGIGGNVVHTLPHPKESTADLTVFQKALGVIWEKGWEIDWLKGLNHLSQKTRVAIPSYPFEKKSCWIEPQKKDKQQQTIKPTPYQRYWKQKGEEYEVDQPCTSMKWIIITEEFEEGEQFLKYLCEPHEMGEIFSFKELSELNEFVESLQASDQPVTIVSFLLRRNQSENLSWEEKQDRGALFLLQLVQACSKHDKNNKLKEFILLVDRSFAFQSQIDPEQAFLQSMVKTANQEFPRINSRVIDVDFKSTHTDLLVQEIRHRSSHPLILLRGKERFIERFDPVTLPKEISLPDHQGCIILLGGTGHIGLQYAQALLEITRQPLILVQYSPIENLEYPKNEKDRKKSLAFQRLKAMAPNRIMTRSVDIADEIQMRQLCQESRELYGSIDSIIHTAGIDASLHYKLMREVDKSFLQQCFYAKRYGLMNVAILAREFNVRHCHIISSISSFLAGIGMYVYSGLHTYIDSFVQQMQEIHPSSWTSVNWEAWETGNKNEEPESFRQGAFGDHLDRLAIKPVEGIAIIKQFWFTLKGSLIVSSQELNERYEQWVERRVVPVGIIATIHKDSRPKLFVDYAIPLTQEQKELCAIWSDVLAIDPIGIDDNFFELGGHSLMALQMIDAIRHQCHQVLSIVDLFEFPTVRKLCKKLFTKASVQQETILQKRAQSRKEHFMKVSKLKKNR